MRFKHYGKTLQLRIESVDDLKSILELDESFWVATSAPVTVFRCNHDFITILDSNSDGRINTQEVRNAISWLMNLLSDCSGVIKETDTISANVILHNTEDGKSIIEAISHVRKALNLTDSEEINLKDVYAFLEYLRKQPMNGDGVVIANAAPAEEIADYIKDVIACTGGVPDVGGKQGINLENINEFKNKIESYLAWREQGISQSDDTLFSEIFPFGEDIVSMYEILSKGMKQVDLFFALCRTISFEPKIGTLTGCSDSKLKDFDFTKEGELKRYLECEPIASPNAEGRLPLDSGRINPLYKEWMESFCDKVLNPVLSDMPEFLSEKEWQTVKKVFRAYGNYMKSKPAGNIESISLDKLLKYRDAGYEKAVEKLIEQDKEITGILKKAKLLQKLLLYNKYLMRFVNNFVSFSQLYAVDERAMFEMGSAVIDGRWFNMALKVTDIADHEKIAKSSNIFVMYVDVSSTKDDKKFTVAIPVTSGTRGNLTVGKRGIFIDIDGNEYNAQVTKIIKNPISILEGMVAPFVRLWDFIIGKIEGISGTSEKELQKKTDALLKTPAPAGGITSGPAAVLVGLSVSAAAIGSSFAFVTRTLSELTVKQVFLGVFGAILLVSIPVALLAIIKLNKQDLSSLLEGCGWAINSRMRFNRAQRKQFTLRRHYPDGLQVVTSPYKWIILAILVIAIIIVLFR